MAGELASAIAKTGQPRNRPQSVGVSEAALDNAFNGRRRADEAKAAKEAADRDKRLGEISKNTIFSKQFKNDIYNRQFQEASKSKLDHIYKTYTEGGNLTVEGMRAIQELRDIGETLYAADTQMFNARTAHDKNPEEFGWFSLGGKSGANVFATLDDPTYDGKADEINEIYSNPAFNMRKVNVGGVELNIGQFNPATASTVNGYKTAEQLISAEDATELVEDPNILSYNGNSKKMFYFTINKDLAAKTAALVSGDMRVGNDAVLQEYKRQSALAAQNGEYLSPTKFLETANSPEIIMNNANGIADKLSKQRYNQQIVSHSPPAPKETSEDKALAKLAVNGTYNETGDTWNYSMGTLDAPFTTQLPAGTTVVESGAGKKTSKLNEEISLGVIPVQVVFGKTLGESYIEYQSKTKPDQKIGEGMTTYKAPLNMKTINAFGQGYQVSGDAILKRIMEGSEQAPLDRIDKFVKQIQGVSINRPTSGKPAATTTKMSATGKVTPMSESEFNAAWSKAKSGTILTGPDGKQYKKP